MDTKRSLYVVSPYLLNNGDGTFSNLIRNTRQELEGSIVDLLSGLPNPFSFEHFASKCATDHQRALDLFQELQKKCVLIGDSEKLSKYRIESVNIEICSQCNGRCSFCPVGLDPLPKSTMSQSAFDKILSRLPSENIDWVSLNHYNEPLLDPGIIDKVRSLKKFGFKLRLFTNGVLLKQEKIEELSKIGNTQLVVVNLPTLQPSQYRRLMGMSYKPAIKNHLLHLIKKRIPTEICINNSLSEAHNTREELEDFFRSNHTPPPRIIINNTHDRAGLIKEEFLIKSKAPTHGCRRFFTQLNISVDGDIFMCCQDYYQESKFGNLLEEDLTTILTSEKASQLRGMAFGVIDSDSDFICNKCVEAHSISLSAKRSTASKICT